MAGRWQSADSASEGQSALRRAEGPGPARADIRPWWVGSGQQTLGGTFSSTIPVEIACRTLGRAASNPRAALHRRADAGFESPVLVGRSRPGGPSALGTRRHCSAVHPNWHFRHLSLIQFSRLCSIVPKITPIGDHMQCALHQECHAAPCGHSSNIVIHTVGQQ